MMASVVLLLLLIGKFACTLVVVLADETRLIELFGRPPCLQWPALTAAAYAKKRRIRMMLVRRVMNGCEKPAFHRIDGQVDESRTK